MKCLLREYYSKTHNYYLREGLLSNFQAQKANREFMFELSDMIASCLLEFIYWDV